MLGVTYPANNMRDFARQAALRTQSERSTAESKTGNRVVA